MRGWGPWNPKAILVSNRILVLVDSMSPWDRPWSRLASISWRCLVIFLASSINAGSWDRRAQVNHFVECFFAFFDREQFGVSFGDPVELLTLTWVEIAGVFPECVA